MGHTVNHYIEGHSGGTINPMTGEAASTGVGVLGYEWPMGTMAPEHIHASGEMIVTGLTASYQRAIPCAMNPELRLGSLCGPVSLVCNETDELLAFLGRSRRGIIISRDVYATIAWFFYSKDIRPCLGITAEASYVNRLVAMQEAVPPSPLVSTPRLHHCMTPGMDKRGSSYWTPPAEAVTFGALYIRLAYCR